MTGAPERIRRAIRRWTSDAVRRRASGPIRRRPAVAALFVLGVVVAVRTVEVLAGVHRDLGAPAATPVLAITLGGALWGIGSNGGGQVDHGSDAGGQVGTDGHDGRVGRSVGAVRRAISPGQRPVVRALLVGGVGVLSAQAVAHALQVGALAVGGAEGGLVLAAENPATKSTAAEAVAGYLLWGVLLTAAGEELLFRGALLSALSTRLSFGWANAVQAALFGCWHLAWPLAILVGPSEPPVSLAVYAVGLLLVTGVVGGAFGVLARATGTLWTPVLAHLIHNGVAVFVHVRAGGIDHGAVLSPALVAGYAGLAGLVRWIDAV
jgi:membrane protease YdiL (CAAX protease family)